MATNDLLVPGTSGCKLLANGADVGWPSGLTAEAWFAGATGLAIKFDALGLHFSADEIASLLSMEFGEPSSARPTKTSLTSGTSISAGAYLELAYNQFTDFQSFTYDWRSDIRDSGRLLLERLKDKPAGTKWRIAAHSQGGLAVVVASKLCASENGDDDTAFSQLVSHIAFVATPFHGTVSAATAILVGDSLTGAFRETFRRVVRSWPAIHQMLPVWAGSVRTKANGVETVAPYNLMGDQAWVGQSVSPAMLQRARDTRAQFLRNPFSRMNGVKVLAYMSEAWGTANRLVMDGGVLTVPPSSDDELGDTLVPAQTVCTMSNDVELSRFLLLGHSGDTMKHFVLSIDPVVASGVKAFFQT